jgi:hypothetical protein
MSPYVRLIGHTALVDDISRVSTVKARAARLHKCVQGRAGHRSSTGRLASIRARGPRLVG